MIDYDGLYNKKYYGADLYTDHLVDRSLRWSVLEDVTLLPYKRIAGNIGGGLIDKNGQYIDGSGLHAGLGCSYTFDDPVIERNDTVVFLGLWPNIWGHCLTDNIRRLWVLNNQEFMNEYGKYKFVYIPFNNEKLIGNFRELLDIIGAGNIRLEAVSKLTRFKRVILPDESFFRRYDGSREYVEEFGTRLYTKEYKSMIDKIRDYAEAHFIENDDKKIFLTGKNRTRYNEFGCRKLELYFEKLGYKGVAPEEYSFREQLNMFLNCKDLVSTVGSASHNLVFLRDHSRVCLIPRTSFISEYQFALDTIHDLDISYVDSSLSLYVHKNHPWGGPNYYIISEQLQSFFNTHIKYKVSRFKFFVFKKLSFSMNEVSKPSRYYKNVCRRYYRGKTRIHMTKISLWISRKLKFWKIIALVLKRIEDFEH